MGLITDLSVVVATHNAAAVIVESLQALCAQRVLEPVEHVERIEIIEPVEGVEIIVADSSTDETPALVRSFTGVRLLHFEEPLTIPELRGRGVAVANGGVIAILDPFAIVAGNWTREVLKAHRESPHPVIGGAVDLHERYDSSLFAWAIYINEYGLFMPPVEGGAVAIVPGCNVSYKRAALFDGDRPRFEVFWKTFVNWDLQNAGAVLWLAPNICVRLVKPVPFMGFLSSRFDHGRCFAGMRRAAWSPWRRSVYAAASVLLPPLMLWRWGRVYWAKRRQRTKLVLTLPLQLMLFGVWAVGEACGYMLGTGRSCRRLFY